MASNMETEQPPTHLESLKADSETFGETNMMEEVSNNPSPVQSIPVSDMKQEPMASKNSDLDFPNVETSVSGPLSFKCEAEAISFQSSDLADSQTLVPLLQPLVAHDYPIERSARSVQLTGKRKSPPESFLGDSVSEKLDASNKRVEPLHHRPWLEQFLAASIRPVHTPSATLSPKTDHSPTFAKKVRQMDPASQKSGKQVMKKKQTGQSQGSTKAQNEGNESLRYKMKESLAAALALVHEHKESPKEKNKSEVEETTVPEAESNEPDAACGISVPVSEGCTPALPTRDESSGQKDGNRYILLQETSNDTKMNYVNQSDVQKTQFDEVFPCDVSFSDSMFSSDELLQGNGLSWVLEPVSDLGENETGGEKSFEDPDLLASKIESELFKLFGGVNKKYKEKGRSLLFNLKDKNNPELRESVMSGKISPERLCSMTAEELASKELSQWRQAKAEEMAEMVVLREADIDVRNLVRKTHKGEFQVEIDPVDSGTVDVSSEITLRSRPRSKAKSVNSSTKSVVKKNDSNDGNTKSNHETSRAMTLASTEGTDPMQGLSMDDEMKDVGFLPPIVSLDEFMESLNSEPPFGSPHGNPSVKEELSTEKSDSEGGSHSKSPSRSPKQSPNEPCESVSSKTEVEKTNNVTSPKPDAGVKSDADIFKPVKTPLVDSIKEDRIWDGILQLSVSSVVSVTGIFKSGEKAKTSEWPTLVEVKGRVRLSAFGKFVQELPMSRSRVLMVMNVVCKDGISQSQRDSFLEVSKSYVADQRVGYAEPSSGVELYLCPPRGKTLDLLSKIISKDHQEEVKCSDDTGLIGVVVWRRAVVASPGSRHKPGSKRQHSSSGTHKSSVLAPVNKKSSTTVNVKNRPVVPVAVTSLGNHGSGNCDDDDEDVPPGFGPVAAKDDDDLPEFNFNSSTGPVTSSPRPPPQSRSMDQVRELILKYGNSAGNDTKRQWVGRQWVGRDDDDDDDIPEWQPQVSDHQIQPPPPPNFRTESGSPFHSRTMTRPPTLLPGAGPPGGWRPNQSAPRQQQYSARRNRDF